MCGGSVMSLKQTSLVAYKQIRNEGLLGKRQKIVYDGFKRYLKATDWEVTNLLCWDDPNKVRPRRNELVRYGLLRDSGIKRKCNVTNRMAIVWEVC